MNIISYYITRTHKRIYEYTEAENLYNEGEIIEIEINGETVTFADPYGHIYPSFEDAHNTIEGE